MSLTAQVLPPSQLPPAQLDLWRAWCAASPAYRRAFLTPDFALAVHAVRPGVRVALLLRGGVPSAVLPFQFPSNLHRLLGYAEPVGCTMSDCFGLVAAPGFQTSIQEVLRAAGLNYFPYDHLDDVQLPLGLPADGQPQPGLLIELPDGPEAYWSDLTAKDKDFVQDTLRRERQLAARVGPLRLANTSRPDQAVLNHLIQAKRQQYQATGVADVFADSWRAALLLRLQQSGSAQCRPFLTTLHAGDTWVASHFGLRFEERLHYWFPVYNPEMKRYAPGRMLLKATIDSAAEFGISVIDRGQGESQAKLDFANQRRQFLTGVWSRPTPLAAASRVLNSIQWRLQAGSKSPSADN
jgi:CelD/BcsL family acetyltransferase involved in cellulose biosynthesis